MDEEINICECSSAALLGLGNHQAISAEGLEYYFEPPRMAQQVSVLKRMIAHEGKVILVIGDRGSGKSTMIQRLIADPTGKWAPARLKVTSRRNHTITASRRLHNRKVYFTKGTTKPAVIIDDAHQLSIDELTLLIQKTESPKQNNPFRCVILYAEPTLQRRLTKLTERMPADSAVETITISPLTEAQTADYLSHRIQKAAQLNHLPFSKKQVKTIHALSGGLPGWINGEAYILLKKMKNRRLKLRRFAENITFGVLSVPAKSTG